MAQPGPEAIWLWIGTIGMTLGTVAFVARGWSVRDVEQQRFYIVTIFITATASVAYFAMATGFGLTEVTLGNATLDIYWARYADWLITTPLLLLDLALLAGANRNTIATLVGLDVFMIGTGAIGALATTSPGARSRPATRCSVRFLAVAYPEKPSPSSRQRSTSVPFTDRVSTLRPSASSKWVTTTS